MKAKTLKARALAIVAAAFCAGLFVTVTPDIASDVGAGPAEDSGLLARNIVTIDTFAAIWAPIAAAAQSVIEWHDDDGSWDRKVARAQGWPYCDPACPRGGRAADSTPIAGVTVAERSTASSNANAVNRIRKGDRQPQGLLAKQNPTFSPSTETVPALPKRIPLGCDAVFSSSADPARAHIYKRCMV
jgi:hypothetical protein